MKEEKIEISDIPSSAPQSETISSIPENGDIGEALRVLDNSNWTNVEQFLHPWGKQRVTLAHLAAYRGKVDMLKRAATLGVDLYAPDEFGRSALYHAADQGHINVIEWLMDPSAAHEGPSETTSPTEDQASLLASGSNTAVHQAVETESHETREDDKLRERSPSSFDIEDKNGWTPLHAAVYGGHLECVRILIEKGLCLANITKTGVTVIDAIFKEVPDPNAFLKEILDKQVSMADDSGHKVKLDFAILTTLPNYARVSEAESTSIAKLFVILALINAVQNSKDRITLRHPLLTIFIYGKLSFELTFIFSVLSFVGSVAYGGYVYSLHTCTKTWMFDDLPPSLSSRILGAIVCVAAILMNILDIVGNCRNKVLLNMFRTHESIAYVYILLVTTQLFMLVLTLSLTVMCTDGRRDGLIMIIYPLTYIFYWFYFMLKLSLSPFIGPCIFMFLAVLVDVLKVLAIFIFLIAGFSILFRILFFDNDQLSTPWKAFAKTLVMMTGEYDYNDLFPSTNKTDDASNVAGRAILFFIFLLLISIVLMNLMIGLAVNDINLLLKKGRNIWIAELLVFKNQWSGLCYLISRLRTRFQNGNQTDKERTRTVLLDLMKGTFNRSRISKDLANALLELALKNSSKRDKKSQANLCRDDIQESLTASRTMLAEIRSIQSSLQGVVVEQQLQNCRIQQLTQDRMTERERRSFPTILWHPKIDSCASPSTESI